MSESAPPQITEIRVHFGGGGKVQIEEYGKQVSEYGINLSRTYAIPPDWTADEVADYELEVLDQLRAQAEPLLQAEHDERMEAREELARRR